MLTAPCSFVQLKVCSVLRLSHLYCHSFTQGIKIHDATSKKKVRKLLAQEQAMKMAIDDEPSQVCVNHWRCVCCVVFKLVSLQVCVCVHDVTIRARLPSAQHILPDLKRRSLILLVHSLSTLSSCLLSPTQKKSRGVSVKTKAVKTSVKSKAGSSKKGDAAEEMVIG